MLESMIASAAADASRGDRRRQRDPRRHRCGDALGGDGARRVSDRSRSDDGRDRARGRKALSARAAARPPPGELRSRRSPPRLPKRRRARAPSSPIPYIVTGTTTGNTAHHIAAFRPQARIVALTPDPSRSAPPRAAVGHRIAADRRIRVDRRAALHDRTGDGARGLRELRRSHRVHDRHARRRRRHQRPEDPPDPASFPRN